MGVHRVWVEEVREPGVLVVAGDEAAHALRVKRLEPGDRVEVLDGRGRVGEGTLLSAHKQGKSHWAAQIDVRSVRQAPPTSPRVVVRTGVPKGERVEQMLDGLSQVGAAAWGPLRTARSVVDPRSGKMDRLTRVAREASKQCGRAWTLEVLPGTDLAPALAESGPRAVLADASGAPYEPTGAGEVLLLVGPEGGWEPAEIERARRAGARVASFGVHVMRVETAAVASAAIVLDAERRAALSVGRG